MTYNTILYQLLEAMSDELSRLSFEAELLIREKSTLTTEVLIGRHEDDFGLPNDYLLIGETYSARRGTLNALKNAIGRMDKAYFIGLAEDMGHDLSIIEFFPCVCGVCECGNNNCGSQLILFYWGAIVYYNHSMVTLDDPYEIPNLQNLINMFDKYKPAHTQVLWGFYGPGFDNSFGFSFNSQPGNASANTWNGAFVYDQFSTDFNLDYGYKLSNYIGGPYRKAFNNSFNIYRFVDPTGYFGGPFGLGFSKAYDVYYA